MGRIEAPKSVGSLVEFLPAPILLMVVLAPAMWDARTRSFSDPRWCGVFYEHGAPYVEVFDEAEVSRKGVSVARVAPPPAAGRGRGALRRPGAVAMLGGAVYAYCPSCRNGKDEGGEWVNPVLGFGPRDIEHRGTELVPGQP